MKSAVLVLLAVAVFLPSAGSALPRFALTGGQTCSSCHVMSSGGGIRNEGGFTTMKRTGLWSLYEAPESNTLFTEQLSWGFDIRNQTAYRYDPERRDFVRRPFFMQIMPYVSYRPMEEVEFVGGVNLVKPEWPSQQRATAAIIVRPLEELAIEAGYFQPDVGLRHDDHTTLTRSTLRLYPGWNELGASVVAAPLEWLTVTAGLFDTRNRRAEIFTRGTDPVIDKGAPLVTGKLHLQHADFDKGLSGFAGASFFHAGGQDMAGLYAGIGLIERASLTAEYVTLRSTTSGNNGESTERAFSIGASYDIVEAFALTARYEEARHGYEGGGSGSTKQYVLGAQIFVLPSLELRPEYRWRDTPTSRIAQWGGQVHLFF